MKVDPRKDYSFVYKGKVVKVAKSEVEQKRAEEIDVNKDGFLSEEEIKDYMIKEGIIKRAALTVKGGKPLADADLSRIEDNFKLTLQGKELETKAYVRDYQQMTDSLKELAKKYPKLAKLESIGKSSEGRDIWVLRIGVPKKGKHKPRLVLTGLHHAREWQTGEAAMYTAEKLLEGYSKDETIKKLLDEFEVDIIPMVNPDGYEYSLKHDSWWRKTRSKHEVNGRITYGVDPNRNYYDERFPHLYRPKGDTPQSSYDDYGASDNPYSDTYRGPKGASEPEIKALQDFSRNPDVKAVIDLHSYGRMILFPWGHTYDEAPDVKLFRELGSYMNKAVDNRFRLEQSSSLYPTSGSSEDWQYVQKHITYTVELGRSFHPSASGLEQDKRDTYNIFLAFMKWLDKHPEAFQMEQPIPPAESYAHSGKVPKFLRMT